MATTLFTRFTAAAVNVAVTETTLFTRLTVAAVTAVVRATTLLTFFTANGVKVTATEATLSTRATSTTVKVTVMSALRLVTAADESSSSSTALKAEVVVAVHGMVVRVEPESRRTVSRPVDGVE